MEARIVSCSWEKLRKSKPHRYCGPSSLRGDSLGDTDAVSHQSLPVLLDSTRAEPWIASTFGPAVIIEDLPK